MTAEPDFSHMHHGPVLKKKKVICANYVSIYLWLMHMKHRQNNYRKQWHYKVKLNLVDKREVDLEAELRQHSVHYALSRCGVEVSFSHWTQPVNWVDRLQIN